MHLWMLELGSQRPQSPEPAPSQTLHGQPASPAPQTAVTNSYSALQPPAVLCVGPTTATHRSFMLPPHLSRGGLHMVVAAQPALFASLHWQPAWPCDLRWPRVCGQRASVPVPGLGFEQWQVATPSFERLSASEEELATRSSLPLRLGPRRNNCGIK